MSTEPRQTDPKVLRVAAGSDCHRCAASIAGVVERGSVPAIEFIGAGAGNQAIKAISIANSLLSKQGLFISVIPIFTKRTMPGNDKTVAMQLKVKVHTLTD